ncbi:MAG: aminodeoxychorismate synthase component I [Alphaproteobacteria bacterium]|nr:aminodeoxychorismate synthase component I [Alphaproteobacteria bacterium]
MTFILLDNTRDKEEGAWLFENPYDIISATSPDDVTPALKKLENTSKNGIFCAGFCSFELAYVLEPCLAQRLPHDRTVPLLWFGLFKTRKKLSYAQATDFLKNKQHSDVQVSELRPQWNAAQYKKRFDAARSYIIAGDIYQINLTFKTQFECMGDPIALYLQLREQQPVSFGAYIDVPEFKVLSLSPELFIRQKGQQVETRPMKGTAPRAYLPDDDKAIAGSLATDSKSRAENLMIVDLMRNDIGRIAEQGSVKVADLFAVETYKTLHQMISTVQATLKPETTLTEFFKAIYAPGSVVGAPKIHAMELIHELEDAPRGIYCGAIGMLGPESEKVFNVAIRTAVLFPDKEKTYKGEMGVGSGIVYDSRAQSEYDECLLKTKFFTATHAPFGLIETLRCDKNDGFYLFDRHLDRLIASAQYFAISCDRAALHIALLDHVVGQKAEHLRVRLELSADAAIQISSAPLEAMALQQTLTFTIAPKPIHSANVHLYHKTTQREFLDTPRQQSGVDEVVFLNERGELTQGSYTNIFLEQADGSYLTPPISAGLLAGTFRAEFMETHRVIEKTLYPHDLTTAEQIYLGNSVRGLLKAVLKA